VTATAIGCSRSATTADVAPPVLVTTTVARTETVRDTLTANGTVVPAAAADWTIVAPENAEIAELPRNEGDTVQAGDLLVRFDIPSISEDLAGRQADVAAAATRVESAKKELAKISALNDQGMVARNQLDAAKAAVVDAQAAATLAQAQLDRAVAASGRAKITAKFPGTVVKVWHQQGDLAVASDTDPVMRVVDPTRLQVAVILSLAELARVAPGQSATVSTPGGAAVTAMVTSRPTPPNDAATSVEIRLSFSAPTTLAADTPVEVEILLDERPNAVVVPRGAVQKDEDSTYVMIAGDDGRAHRHDVRLGLTTRDLAQVVSGVAVGDRVITRAANELIDGMAVQVER
jgi:RND family efflux transporter MFP subunit